MTFLEILLTSVSLSLDAVAVSVAASAMHHFKLRQALKVAFFFGFFQGGMPLLGWLLGYGFKGISAYDHIIGFFLLLLVAGKMAWDIFQDEDKKSEWHISETKVLTALAVATSIDAFVVGITFAFIKVNAFFASWMIFLITFALCLVGLFVGKYGRQYVGKKIEILGVVILVALAFKILFHHM